MRTFCSSVWQGQPRYRMEERLVDVQVTWGTAHTYSYSIGETVETSSELLKVSLRKKKVGFWSMAVLNNTNRTTKSLPKLDRKTSFPPPPQQSHHRLAQDRYRLAVMEKQHDFEDNTGGMQGAPIAAVIFSHEINMTSVSKTVPLSTLLKGWQL